MFRLPGVGSPKCANPPRAFLIVLRIAGLGGIRCDVCGAEFTEK